MRIIVFGAGAVGGYFGGRLAASGEEVSWLARGATLAALRERGLEVLSLKGDFALPPQPASNRAGELGPADVVLLAVKAWQVAEAALTIGPWLHADSLVVPLQNGVEAPDQLAATLGAEPVVGGVCKIVCEVVAPGRLRHFGAEPVVELGPLEGPSADPATEARRTRQLARAERLRAAFERAGVSALVHPDIRIAQWEKFLFIASVSGVGAVAGQPVGALRTDPETRRELEAAMAEVRAVALARGVPLDAGVIAKAMGFVDRLPADSTASMQRDLAAGRPSELEAQNGAVVRLGREAGVPTPVHERLYRTLLERLA